MMSEFHTNRVASWVTYQVASSILITELFGTSLQIVPDLRSQ